MLQAFIFATAVLGEAALSFLGLNLFGDGPRDLLDPKLRGVSGRMRET